MTFHASRFKVFTDVSQRHPRRTCYNRVSAGVGLGVSVFIDIARPSIHAGLHELFDPPPPITPKPGPAPGFYFQTPRSLRRQKPNKPGLWQTPLDRTISVKIRSTFRSTAKSNGAVHPRRPSLLNHQAPPALPNRSCRPHRGAGDLKGRGRFAADFATGFQTCTANFLQSFPPALSSSLRPLCQSNLVPAPCSIIV